jgi:hypothetical protein
VTTDILFPLRSNAHSLVAGSGVASVRRRLKLASILYDRILFEGGSLHILAGPTGGSTWMTPLSDVLRTRWDTPTARHSAIGRPFGVSIAPETTVGVPASGPYRPVVASETTISWDVSLEPFVQELPNGCDWIGFAGLREPEGELEQHVRRWQRLDDRNRVLAKTLPIRFVRSRVIEDANHDLGVALLHGAAVSPDSLHKTVMLERFADEDGWQVQGFALAILLPQVADLPWEAIAELRRHQAIEYFRRTLQDLEEEVLAAGAEDLEGVTHYLYDTRLAQAVEKLEGLGALVARNTASLVIGCGSGLATLGIAGPLGAVAGGAIGTGIGAVVDYRRVHKKNREREWVAIDVTIRNMT